MEKRTKSIEDSIEDADRQKNEAGEMKRAYEKQLKKQSWKAKESSMKRLQKPALSRQS
jgi:F0F1-type ATP synthase membrane subunit b/b'